MKAMSCCSAQPLYRSGDVVTWLENGKLRRGKIVSPYGTNQFSVRPDGSQKTIMKWANELKLNEGGRPDRPYTPRRPSGERRPRERDGRRRDKQNRRRRSDSDSSRSDGSQSESSGMRRRRRKQRQRRDS